MTNIIKIASQKRFFMEKKLKIYNKFKVVTLNFLKHNFPWVYLNREIKKIFRVFGLHNF
jgi:hypothetical protein